MPSLGVSSRNSWPRLPRDCLSASWNSRPTSLSGTSSTTAFIAVSRAWTGRLYLRSSRHTWHTFFALATSWQMMVAL